MGRNKEPAFAVLRVRRDLLTWDALSPEQQSLAIVLQNVLVQGDVEWARAEAARLNAMNGDERDVYVYVYARVTMPTPSEPEVTAVLGRSDSAAVVAVPGRRFPGITLQGDTLFSHVQELRRTRDRLTDTECLDSLEMVLEDLEDRLALYKRVLEGHAMPRPWSEA